MAAKQDNHVSYWLQPCTVCLRLVRPARSTAHHPVQRHGAASGPRAVRPRHPRSRAARHPPRGPRRLRPIAGPLRRRPQTERAEPPTAAAPTPRRLGRRPATGCSWSYCGIHNRPFDPCLAAIHGVGAAATAHSDGRRNELPDWKRSGFEVAGLVQSPRAHLPRAPRSGQRPPERADQSARRPRRLEPWPEQAPHRRKDGAPRLVASPGATRRRTDRAPRGTTRPAPRAARRRAASCAPATARRPEAGDRRRSHQPNCASRSTPGRSARWRRALWALTAMVPGVPWW
jgi:ATP-dependent helicase HrpA